MRDAIQDPPIGPLQVFRGFEACELSVFDRFEGLRNEREPGFVTAFLGVRTRMAFLAGVSAPEGIVLGLPIPTDDLHAETVEWIGLLESVLAARGSFAAMELGAGWGPWLVASASACRHLEIAEVHLAGVEANPGHMAFMREHFRDNDLDPDAHTLIEAAVGVQAGRAR